MTALRRIHSWLPLLQRPCAQSCQRVAPATCTFHHAAAAAAAAASQHRRRRGASVLQVREFALSAFKLKSTDDFNSSQQTGCPQEEEEEEEDFMEDSEVEELFQQQVPAGIGDGQHRVFIVHPDVKWGSRKQHLTTGKTNTQTRGCGS